MQPDAPDAPDALDAPDAPSPAPRPNLAKLEESKRRWLARQKHTAAAPASPSNSTAATSAPDASPTAARPDRAKLEESKRRWLARQRAETEATASEDLSAVAKSTAKSPAPTEPPEKLPVPAKPPVKSFAPMEELGAELADALLHDVPADASDRVDASTVAVQTRGRRQRSRRRPAAVPSREDAGGASESSFPLSELFGTNKTLSTASSGASPEASSSAGGGCQAEDGKTSKSGRRRRDIKPADATDATTDADATPSAHRLNNPLARRQFGSRPQRTALDASLRNSRHASRHQQPASYADPRRSPRHQQPAGYGDANRTMRSWRERPSAPPQPQVDPVLEQLRTVDVELTRALARYETSSSSRSRVQRQLVGNTSKYAYVDDSDVVGFHEKIPDPALVFPFELDDFQKRAILHVEAQNSVFVAAHTSAGKTVVAEYAIALADSLGSKVFYTSPIKTLSNQKLRDFRDKFGDVGLVTGDVSINDNAQCVIMTTEILRSMLYRGADAIRDVSYVIFDEVQFLNDEERGVVWEESIIMLPPHIGIIMLSATVPNALEFAAWVGKTKDRRVAVVATSKRPVPLEHAWLHAGSDGPDTLQATVLLHQGGKFLSENYRAAMKTRDSSKKKESQSKKSKKRSKGARNGHDGVEDGQTTKAGRVGDDPVNKEVVQGAIAVDEPTGGSPLKAESEGKPMGDDSQVTSIASEADLPTISDAGLGGDAVVGKAGNLEMPAPDGQGSKRGPKGRNKNKGPSARGASLQGGADNGGGRGPNSRRSPWTPVVKFVHENDLTPAVLFCFSKKKCEQAVESLENSDLLPDAGDKAFVHSFFESAVVRLREEDRNLPQVLRTRANLKRGISAHHAGLLPLIKEITEILFSKGLVKILFATETFAMGVNMPARTVIFTGVRKNDGRRFRHLEAGEYTQMSGRAGRRGLDSVGHVYLFFPPDERIPDERQLCQVMTGNPILLKSAFRLTYNMILNVLRVDELRVEEMMKQSFSEAGEDSKTLGIASILDKADDTLSGIKDPPESPIKPGNRRTRRATEGLRSYVEAYVKFLALNAKLTPTQVGPVLKAAITPGRVVVAHLVESEVLGLGVVYSVVCGNRGQDRDRSRSSYTSPPVDMYTTVWVATIVGVEQNAINKHPRSALLLPEIADSRTLGRRRNDEPRVVTSNGLIVCLRKVRALDIVYISSDIDIPNETRHAAQLYASGEWYMHRDARRPQRTLHHNATFLQGVVSRWFQLHRESMEDPAAAFPISVVQQKSYVGDEGKGKRTKPNMNVCNEYRERDKLCTEIATSFAMAESILSLASEAREAKIGKLIAEETVRSKMAALQTISKTGSEPSLLPEYLKRVQVLQKLNYVGEDGLSVQLKGRVACEVATADSVVLTEIVLENVLRGLEAAEVASLLSSLVCRKKNTGDIQEHDAKLYSENYCAAKASMRNVVQNAGKVQEECGVELAFDIGDGSDDFEGSICRWDLAHAVYDWARGEPFCNITSLTEQQEGDIVVCVKRLSELLKDAQAVAKGVGNEELCEVLEEATMAIRRDVIFNGSLYLDES